MTRARSLNCSRSCANATRNSKSRTTASLSWARHTRTLASLSARGFLNFKSFFIFQTAKKLGQTTRGNFIALSKMQGRTTVVFILKAQKRCKCFSSGADEKQQPTSVFANSRGDDKHISSSNSIVLQHGLTEHEMPCHRKYRLVACHIGRQY